VKPFALKPELSLVPYADLVRLQASFDEMCDDTSAGVERVFAEVPVLPVEGVCTLSGRRLLRGRVSPTGRRIANDVNRHIAVGRVHQ
jgi:hypothetical protein